MSKKGIRPVFTYVKAETGRNSANGKKKGINVVPMGRLPQF